MINNSYGRESYESSQYQENSYFPLPSTQCKGCAETTIVDHRPVPAACQRAVGHPQWGLASAPANLIMFFTACEELPAFPQKSRAPTSSGSIKAGRSELGHSFQTYNKIQRKRGAPHPPPCGKELAVLLRNVLTERLMLLPITLRRQRRFAPTPVERRYA